LAKNALLRVFFNKACFTKGMKRITGQFVETTTSGEVVRAFVPQSLPPNPPLRYGLLSERLQQATARLSELRVASHLVPNPDLFNYAFVRKEAVLSSQIEGIQATLTDLLAYEADPEQESADLQEVCNYLDALQFGRKQLADPKGLPLSLRLIKEMHKRLMRGVRGASKQPGDFRNSQNWIGGTRPSNAHFVPPPPTQMQDCLQAFEGYLHEESNEHALIRIGLAHVQFESIHPFLDGNGRLGRLLIALLLETWGLLDARLLYLSLYFKRHQQEYYRRLDAVRSEGDWEGWISFFLEGVCSSSEEAIGTSQKLFWLFDRDRKHLLSSPMVVVPAIRLFEELPSHPILTINQVVKLLKTTKPTAAKAVDVLVKNGILEETTGAKRNRMFGYKKYLEILKTDVNTL
jgi:Fic family protein